MPLNSIFGCGLVFETGCLYVSWAGLEPLDSAPPQPLRAPTLPSTPVS